MKNFRFFLMLTFTMFIVGLNFSYAISEKTDNIDYVVDVDVGVEAVAVATLDFTSIDFVIYERQRSFIVNNKITFLEYSIHKEIWKFENIPLTNKIQNSLKNNRLIFATSGGLSDNCFC